MIRFLEEKKGDRKILIVFVEFLVAFERVINVPKRDIGSISVKRLLDAASRAKVSAFEVAKNLVEGQNIYHVEAIRSKRLREFVQVILDLQQMRRDHVRGMMTDRTIR
jgi:superfamily I DNA/RNA helicase